MRRVVLLGNPQTKRTIYLTEHAARQIGLHVHFWDWNRWQELFEEQMSPQAPRQETLVKIDPPLWESCSLEELNSLTEEYREKLSAIQHLSSPVGFHFFNNPETISALLDKRDCKRTLEKSGLPVTKEMKETVRTPEQLLAAMELNHIPQVFLKPVNGSGATGVAAFRMQPKTGRMALYTCALTDPATGHLVNTKKLRCFTDPSQMIPLLNRILALDCVVERWYAKAEHQGHSYDLRVVIQDNRLDYVLARLSKGPITNLHLNNHPMAVEELHLPDRVMDSVAQLCQKAAACYPGLRSAGIDVLLEKGSLTPRIIEMNGQGDLIYQDIYQNNLIYRHQVQMMMDWQRRV